jgi:hypothetical protein
MDRLAAGVETGQQPVRIATRRPETSTRMLLAVDAAAVALGAKDDPVAVG